MAGKAKYQVMIPKVDNLGNPLTDLASAAHHYLFYGPAQIEGSYVDPNKKGNWRDDPQEPHDMLVCYAEDSPEMDSQVKQLAAYIGDVANQWGIFVTKEGKQGIHTWVINNPMFRQGEPAEPIALAQGPPSIESDQISPAPGLFPPGQPDPAVGTDQMQ